MASYSSITVAGGKRYKQSSADRSDAISSNGNHGSTKQPPAKMQPYHYQGITVNDGKKRKLEAPANHLGSVSSLSPGIVAFQPPIFKFRASFEVLENIPNTIINFKNNSFNFNNSSSSSSSSKRAAFSESNSSAEPATKRVKSIIPTPTQAAPKVLRKKKCRSYNGRKKRSPSIDENEAPPAIFAHKPKATDATTAPTKVTVTATATASRSRAHVPNKKRRSDDSMNEIEMGAPLQRKKIAQQQSADEPVQSDVPIFRHGGYTAAAKVDSNADMQVDSNQETTDYYCSSSSDEDSLAGLSFLPDTPMDYSSESDSEEGSLESTSRQDWDARMSNDDAATIIQAFIRGNSTRTMKPRARPQAELATNHGQEWEMEEEDDNHVDYAATSTEDASSSIETATEEEADFLSQTSGEMEEEDDNDADTATSTDTTVEEANDGDVGGVVDEDAIELAPQGKAVEEGDEREDEVVADNRVQPQLEFDVAHNTADEDDKDASSSSDTTVEEANDGDSGASLEAEEVNEQISNVLAQTISAVERRERKERSYLREKARLECTLDGDYWRRPTRRRKIVRV